MELTLRFVTTLATTVPTFFIRLKPTSSIAKPACMNITRQAAAITQTVSAATPAAWEAVGSSASTSTGTSAATTAKAAAMANTGLRLESSFHTSAAAPGPLCGLRRYPVPGKDLHLQWLPPADGSGSTLGLPATGSKRVLVTNRLGSPRAHHTREP